MNPEFTRTASATLSGTALLIAGGLLCLVVFGAVLVLASRAREERRSRQNLELRLAELNGQLHAMLEQGASGQNDLARSLDERLGQMSHRLGLGLHDQSERTAKSLHVLYERLAIIDRAQTNLTTLSGEMLSLKDILSNKQARGAWGQGRMEAIIRDALPSAAYRFQATLSNNSRPDCLVRMPETALELAIDSKFPLEAFTLLKEAQGADALRAAEARVRRDMIIHVQDMAQKYLIAGETHETAILFVPAESLYADLHETFDDLVQKAWRAHIIIASPNMLMLLIQTLQSMFRDSAMREQAGVIKREVGRMLDDVTRLRDRVGDLQRHFGLAAGDLEKLGTSAEKISRRARRIGDVDLSDDELPAPDPAQAQPRLVS